MIYGEFEVDVYGMDVVCYGKFVENKQYIKEIMGQFYFCCFVMIYLNE